MYYTPPSTFPTYISVKIQTYQLTQILQYIPLKREELKPKYQYYTLTKVNILKTFIYLFLATLGLRCCAQVFSSCGARASHRRGFSYCGARAQGNWASVVVA